MRGRWPWRATHRHCNARRAPRVSTVRMDRDARSSSAPATRGVNPLVYWLVARGPAAVLPRLLPLSRIGREHIPQEGPVIFAANHRSFLDPFVIGDAGPPADLLRRQEGAVPQAASRLVPQLRSAPSRSTAAPATSDAMATARAILERGDVRRDLPRGHAHPPRRARPPKRGVGRLALETGAPVVPVAVIGTEDVRRGWRIRPHKVRIRAGRPLHLPAGRRARRRSSPRRSPTASGRASSCSGSGSAALPPLRRAAIVGAGSWGTEPRRRARARGPRGRARLPHRASRPRRSRARASTSATCPASRCPTPSRVTPRRRARRSTAADLVCLAVPARALPAAVAAHGDAIPPRAGVARALQGPRRRRSATLPSALRRRARPRARRRLPRRPRPRRRRARARRRARRRLAPTAAFARQLAERARAAPASTSQTHDRRHRRRARRRGEERRRRSPPPTAAVAGPNAAGAAAGKVFAEVDALRAPPRRPARDVRRPRRRRRPRRHRRRRRAAATAAPASCSASGVPGRDDRPRRSARPPRRSTRSRCSPTRAAPATACAAPAVDGLADVVEGRARAPSAWAARGVTAPGAAQRAQARRGVRLRQG